MKGAIKLMIVGFLFCARFVLLAKIQHNPFQRLILLFFCTCTAVQISELSGVCVQLTSTDLGFLPSFRAPIANYELAYCDELFHEAT